MFGLLNLWRVERFIHSEYLKRVPENYHNRYRHRFHFYAMAFYMLMVLRNTPKELDMTPYLDFGGTKPFDTDRIYMIAHLNSDYFWPRINTMLICGRDNFRNNARGIPTQFSPVDNEGILLRYTHISNEDSHDHRLLERIFKYVDIPKYSLYTSNFVCFSDAVVVSIPRKHFILDRIPLSDAEI